MQVIHEYERLQSIRLGHTPSAQAPAPHAAKPGVRP
jgi:hypothetical protein